MKRLMFDNDNLDGEIKLSRTIPLTVRFSTVLKDKKGFTLAEVLITLGIIGVVAALTIPTIISNNKKNEYLNRLKKSYAQINQALIQMTADQGCPGDLSCLNSVQNTTPTSFGDDLVKYIKTIKNCGIDVNKGCMTTKEHVYYNLILGTYNLDSNSMYKFITADGTAIELNMYGSIQNRSNGKTGDLKKTYGQMIVDVNGPTKGPNADGIDIFYFWISDGHGVKIYPMGGADDLYAAYKDASGNYNSCYPGNTQGYSCAARIMDEGWQMNYYGTKGIGAYAAGIMPGADVMIAIAKTANNHLSILNNAITTKNADKYINDLRMRQITI